MKKSYSKPMAEVEVFSVKSVISVSVVGTKEPTHVIKYTKGRLNF